MPRGSSSCAGDPTLQGSGSALLRGELLHKSQVAWWPFQLPGAVQSPATQAVIQKTKPLDIYCIFVRHLNHAQTWLGDSSPAVRESKVPRPAESAAGIQAAGPCYVDVI